MRGGRRIKLLFYFCALVSGAAGATTFSSAPDAREYLRAINYRGDPLFSEGKSDGIARGMTYPLDQGVLDAIAEREISERNFVPPPATDVEQAKLAKIDAAYAKSPVKLYSEVNLSGDWQIEQGQYISVFYKQKNNHFKHVFSEFVSASWNGKGTPMGAHSVLHCDQFHCSQAFNNALMDFYEILYLYGGGVQDGGIHMTSHLNTLGTPDSAGCVRTRLAAAYRLFELRKLIGGEPPPGPPRGRPVYKPLTNKIVYRIVNEKEQVFAPRELPPFAIFWLRFSKLEEFRHLSDHDLHELFMGATGLGDEMNVVTAAQGHDETALVGDKIVTTVVPMPEPDRMSSYQEYFLRWDVRPYTEDQLESLP